MEILSPLTNLPGGERGFAYAPRICRCAPILARLAQHKRAVTKCNAIYVGMPEANLGKQRIWGRMDSTRKDKPHRLGLTLARSPCR